MMFIKSPRQCTLTHGSSTSVLLEPHSLKTLFTVGVSYCLTTDWSRSGRGLSHMILFSWVQTQCRYCACARDPGGWYRNSLPGKGSGFKGGYGLQEGLILQCRRDSAGARGWSRSWEAAPSGLFTADTSPLAKGMCVQVVYDPNPESSEYLEFRIWFKAIVV